MGQVSRDPNGGCCHRWKVYCFGCGKQYVTCGVKWRVERRKGCQSCVRKGPRKAAVAP